ncbi:16S rRNA (guanine(527)-N(7))-methyltransferase RsmG [Nocardioides mangrovicus]|uniref:Ribosomal RNA small subunit methyltransferase G n=1 Tax=Nocardioides mangrovicus TaxID=2478913 RepID=A0A3L8NY70_9ACTN|nr:16S rRNA (guanine(527)-N(7))-methyltransferase RsmG [Nocardioides mangrovicus]RLV48090.1 16S rRNA (guanine(527)-N(7))-methyltransferase RsmG [Nocardioides mangrovicus]
MASVPRETDTALGPTPEAATSLFGERLGLAERYVASLADAGVVRGLIGPREVPRLWERHVLNCALLADPVPQHAEVADIGSGAGLPGVVLALRRPDLTLTLVEPLLRRCEYLAEVVEELGLGNVEVLRSRAEDLHGRRSFGVVTARAVAPLERLVRWTLPLVAPGGELLAMKGRSAEQEVQAASARLRGTTVAVEQYGAGWVPEPTTVVRVRVRDRQGRGNR